MTEDEIGIIKYLDTAFLMLAEKNTDPRVTTAEFRESGWGMLERGYIRLLSYDDGDDGGMRIELCTTRAERRAARAKARRVIALYRQYVAASNGTENLNMVPPETAGTAA